MQERASDALLLVSLPVSELEDWRSRVAKPSDPGEFHRQDAGTDGIGLETGERRSRVSRSFGGGSLPTRSIARRGMQSCSAFHRKMYRDSQAEFPRDVSAKPPGFTSAGSFKPPIRFIHELFDRLYQDWSTLEGFQQTRGVLRHDGDSDPPAVGSTTTHSLLILPGSPFRMWEGKTCRKHEILPVSAAGELQPAIIDQPI